MPSKKKKYNARFPPARIKKIMQSDEDVGKVAAAVPVIISRALELFISALILDASKQTKARNAKTLSPFHIKQAIESDKQFDFLRGVVANISQIEDDADDDDGKKPARRKRKPSTSRTQVSADVPEDSSDEETETDVENDGNVPNSEEESSHSDAPKHSPVSRANPTLSRAKQPSTETANQTAPTASVADEIPAIMSHASCMADHIPVNVSVDNQIPANVSVTNEIPTTVSPTNQIPATVSPTNQTPIKASAINQIPASVCPTNPIPSNQLPSHLSASKSQTVTKQHPSLPIIPPYSQHPGFQPTNQIYGPDIHSTNLHAALLPGMDVLPPYSVSGDTMYPTVPPFYNHQYRYPYPPLAHMTPPYSLPFYDPSMPHHLWPPVPPGTTMPTFIPPEYPRYGRRHPDEDYDV